MIFMHMSFVIGDSSAHLSLAQCYNKGNGVEQSFEKAFEHYLAAAKAGIMSMSASEQ